MPLIDPDGQILTCKVLSNSTLRGSITEWIDARTFKIDHSWQIKRDILQDYTFELMTHIPLSKNAIFTVKFYDVHKKIIG